MTQQEDKIFTWRCPICKNGGWVNTSTLRAAKRLVEELHSLASRHCESAISEIVILEGRHPELLPGVEDIE